MRNWNIIISLLFCGMIFGTFSAGAQVIPDTLIQVTDTAANHQTKKKEATIIFSTFTPKPAAAVKWAIVPGLGQVYNRKYWKLPLVYGGFLGLGYVIALNNNHYHEYKTAYIDIIDTDNNTNSFVNFIPAGYTAATVNKTWLASVLKQKKDSYWRYRDMTILGTVAFYALTIIDAYVDAQMFDFDISPNLSFRVEPSLIQDKYYNFGTIGVRCQFNF